MSVCPFLRNLVSQFKSYRDETFPKVIFLLQVEYKSERAGELYPTATIGKIKNYNFAVFDI